MVAVFGFFVLLSSNSNRWPCRTANLLSFDAFAFLEAISELVILSCTQTRKLSAAVFSLGKLGRPLNVGHFVFAKIPCCRIGGFCNFPF
jgi:hypothetical protein